MRIPIAIALGAALSLASASGWAQEFGRQGTLAIAAERVFGLPYYEQVEVDYGPPPGEVQDEWTTIGLAWGEQHTPYTRPRFAIDYFVIDGLSLGGSLAFASVSHDRDPDGGDDDSHAFLFAPRVGYALPFGTVAGFWPRGGFTYASEGNGPDRSELALTAEAMFWIAPAEGVAFLVGPTFDFGLTGEEDGNPDADLQRIVIGIGIGLMGWL
jgi:hypothetical protein